MACLTLSTFTLQLQQSWTLLRTTKPSPIWATYLGETRGR